MKRRDGFSLVTVFYLMVTLMALGVVYFFLTNVELVTTTATANSVKGFYAAEAGLNLRGEIVRKTFLGYNRPTGKAYTTNPCKSASDYTPVDSKDNFVCRDYDVGGRKVVTYVKEDPNNSLANPSVAIENSSRFRGLNALQYKYSVFSEARNLRDNAVETQLEMVFRSRLVPLFQFAAFYNKDLEINPGENMTLTGRVHTNGDLYMSPNGHTLDIQGAITVARKTDGSGGSLFRRRKHEDVCQGTVRADDAKASTNPNPTLAATCGGSISQSTLNAWNGQIQTGLETITVPDVATFAVGNQYWNQADLRIVLDLSVPSAPKVIVPTKSSTATNMTSNVPLTAALNSCSSLTLDLDRPYLQSGLALPLSILNPLRPAEYSLDSFQDNRESGKMSLLEIDVKLLLSCMNDKRSILFQDSPSTEKAISDTSDGGLVVYVTVVGPRKFDAAGNPRQSRYGTRLRNGSTLAAGASLFAPEIRGLTIVSDEAVYVQGDFNKSSWKPASILADAVNILSNSYNSLGHDAASTRGLTEAEIPRPLLPPIPSRKATDTTVNAAFLSGTPLTGNAEGAAGRNKGQYNGGLENYPRFHEDWSGRTLTYSGSFVSLNASQHATGAWRNTGASGNVYNAPIRAFSYDMNFNNAEKLPPLTPRFVYLQQERFVRNFER